MKKQTQKCAIHEANKDSLPVIHRPVCSGKVIAFDDDYYCEKHAREHIDVTALIFGHEEHAKKLQRDLKWATDSRQRWMTTVEHLETKLNKVHASVSKLRARSLKKTLSAELDKIITQLEA
jgi:hypothetical protein